MRSIRSELLGSLFGSLALLLACAAIIAYYEIADEIGELYDAQLIAAADTGSDAVTPEPRVSPEPGDDPRNGLVIAVWEHGASTPVYRSRARAELPRRRATGLGTETIQGTEWRMYAGEYSGRWIEVAQPLSVRREAAAQVAGRAAAPFLLLIPAVGLAVWYLVGRGLGPLRRFADELGRRSPLALQPVATTGLPVELLATATALNDLMVRLERAVVAQERFVADAAHELLTPLAALQVQVQVFDKARTEEKRAQAAQDVRASLNRCVGLARQLLVLARQSSDSSRTVMRLVALGALAHHAAEEALASAHSREIDLGVAPDDVGLVLGDPAALQILLRNLVDNAIKYSPAGGRVDIGIKADGNTTVLSVSDAGPGIPAEERARIFDRFYRMPGTESDGTGLGLAIVKQIAERHGANIRLESPGAFGGLDVTIEFPGLPKC